MSTTFATIWILGCLIMACLSLALIGYAARIEPDRKNWMVTRKPWLYGGVLLAYAAGGTLPLLFPSTGPVALGLGLGGLYNLALLISFRRLDIKTGGRPPRLWFPPHT